MHPLIERIGTVGVWLGGALGAAPAADSRQAAVEVERLGYGSLWIGEALSKEAMADSAILLGATDRLVVGTGIANIWARDPAAMNAGARTLADAFPGRFVNAIGVSHRPLIDARGQEYEKPLARMRSYLDQMDNAVYQGPEPAMPAPRLLAALRPKMLGLARDRTDGAHPYFVPTEHTSRARETLGTGPLLIPEQAVLLESDPTRAREIAREHTSRYLALPNYTNNLREFGFGDDDLAGGGSDRLVDAIVAWGDVDAIRTRVTEHRDAGADHVLIQPLGGLGLDQLRELAPALI